MATKVDRLFPHIIEPLEADRTSASPCPARGNVPALVIATRNEIVAAGIEALLLGDGYSVVARCSSEDDLLRSSEVYRPDIIVLAENFVGQEATKMVLQLRAHNRSVAIVVLLEERDAIKPAELLELDVKGILLSVTCARTFLDCVESVHHGRKWVDPDLLLRHLTMAERAPEDACSLTSREADIGHLISQGLRNKEIARELHMSESTVKMHLRHIYRTLHFGSRTQLALWMARVCAQMPITSNEARPAGELIALDSAVARRRAQLKDLA